MPDLILRHATQAEAELGEIETVVVSPKTARQSIDRQIQEQVLDLLAEPAGIATLDDSGAIVPEQLPLRLRTVTQNVGSADWNAITQNGWYSTTTGHTNTPDNARTVWVGEVIVLENGWIIQTLSAPASGTVVDNNVYLVDIDGYQFTDTDGALITDGSAAPTTSSTETWRYRREFTDGWSSWMRMRSTEMDLDLVYSRSASPAFTGTPTAPTPSAGTNTTQVATAAFVQTAISTLTASVGTTYAPLASPVFTGNPTAPTPTTADNDTSIATTAFVKNQGYITSSALSPYLTTSAAALTYAPVNDPTFTGAPNSPTPATTSDSTRIATTAWVRLQGYTVSDIRLKTAVRPSLMSFGPKIDALDFVEFEYLDNPGRVHTGLIAQDVYAVWPTLVVPGTDLLPETHSDFRPWHLNPKEAILPILQELQALRARIAQLEDKAAQQQ